ncbi:hypothetical protein HGRIS_003831 [Hohenbuehelia grisea]|uniref:Protein-S-isoprenylcysteine O-methyltransferase n=1 Tax=Hohenbuehelia grisea TaxID=104357 RepID=A0ABR3JHJ4_9AGAR
MPPSAALKSFAIFLSALCYFINSTPPLPPPKSNANVYTGNFFERFMRPIGVVTRTLTCTMFVVSFFFEVIRLLPTTVQAELPRGICASQSRDDGMPSVNSIFVAGCIACIVGAAARKWCYTTLGDLFTFEVTLKPCVDSTDILITSGPYAFVRHPSYIAAAANHLGVATMLLADGGWIRKCEVTSTPFGTVVLVWLGLLAWTVWSLMRRIKVEDRNLKMRFGRTWEQYAQKVPYKVIPGLY